MAPPVLEIRNVGKVFSRGLIKKEELVALDDFSLRIDADRPTITAIAGESGSGKTTLALLVLGLLTPSSGQILFGGRDTARMSARERTAFRQQVQAIFQDPFEVFNPFYRVDHVLETVVKKFKLAPDRRAADQLIRENLSVLGLKPDEVLGRFPHQLSGGQRQRIMVARAVLPDPKVIVADEPVSMVDASLRALILDNMLRLKRERGISFLYITHDLSTAYQISDDIYVMYLGGVAEHGDVARVIEHPRHPYTKLLVESVPIPDPAAGWGENVELPPEDEVRQQTRGGCRFARRCPHVMDICRENPPPLYEVGPNQYASCFLYRDQPVKAAGGAGAPAGRPLPVVAPS
jgi:peptide/nickel transport system ATP-binding protein